jgi:hypothetical protein
VKHREYDGHRAADERTRFSLRSEGFELNGSTFELRDGSTAITFRPKENEIGYHFVTPERKREVADDKRLCFLT